MTSLWPSSLRDKSNLALEKCIQKAFDIDLKPCMIYLFDHVSVKLLPALKKHFAIDDFSWALADEQGKRNLLKRAYQLHKIKGTNAAIRLVLDALGIEAEIREWFQYRGRPNFFELTVNNLNLLIAKFSQFYSMLQIYKRATAHIDKIAFRLSVPARLYNGLRVVSTSSTTHIMESTT